MKEERDKEQVLKCLPNFKGCKVRLVGGASLELVVSTEGDVIDVVNIGLSAEPQTARIDWVYLGVKT